MATKEVEKIEIEQMRERKMVWRLSEQGRG
jgi:hypothetical protein